jgi:hypothetical protein
VTVVTIIRFDVAQVREKRNGSVPPPRARTCVIRAIDKQRAPHDRRIISFAGARRVAQLRVRKNRVGRIGLVVMVITF